MNTTEQMPPVEEQMPPDRRQAPHAKDAEDALLCTLFRKADYEPEVMDEIVHIVTPTDFQRKQNKIVYEAMVDLFNAGEPFDFVNVWAQVQPKGISLEYMARLNDIKHALDVRGEMIRYARLIRQASEKRRLLMAAKQIEDLVYAGEVEHDELFDRAESILARVEPEKTVKSGPVPITELLLPYWEQLEAAYVRAKADDSAVPLTGIMTNKLDLDAMTGGFQNKDFIIVAARPSIGKTAFALDLLLEGTRNENVYGCLFSAEMSKDKPLIDRIMSNRSHVSAGSLKSGLIAEDEWPRLTQAIGSISNRLYIDDTPNMSTMHIRREARKLRRKIGPNADFLIVIDYLQLLRGPKSASRYEEVSAISRELKSLAKELNCPVIALSQLSRSVEQRQNKRPMMSDLRESGQIEQDADVIMFLYRDDYYDAESDRKNIMEVIIGKQRNGPTGTVELVFLKEYGRFVSLERTPGV